MYICNLALRNSIVMECLWFGWWTKPEQKHWVTKCHLEVFLNVDISHCCKCNVFLFWFRCDTCSALVSNANPQWGNLLRKHIPWFHGAADLAHTGISTLTYLRYVCVCSHLYWCVCPNKTYYLTVYVCSLWPKPHDHRSTFAVRCSAHMLLSERDVHSPCLCTFVTCNGRKSYI